MSRRFRLRHDHAEASQQLEGADLPLLTEDINEVRLQVNQALTTRSQLDARVDAQFALRDRADVITAMIRSDYPERQRDEPGLNRYEAPRASTDAGDPGAGR